MVAIAIEQSRQEKSPLIDKVREECANYLELADIFTEFCRISREAHNRRDMVRWERATRYVLDIYKEVTDAKGEEQKLQKSYQKSLYRLTTFSRLFG